MLIIDARRNVFHAKAAIFSLGSPTVLFALLRLHGETWPDDATREELLVRAFRAREERASYWNNMKLARLQCLPHLLTTSMAKCWQACLFVSSH